MAYFIDPDRCIECGACMNDCPTDCITAGSPYTIEPSRCIECGACFDICPTDAPNPK
ncbi:4Fe-4S dicluster domain-containing protein [Heliobacterium undosum]|uniref:Ferredoxin n=1 Tax=Heliomicrobium undosum TaxID=121734 RepID=A0A845KYS5_9FIRM|nr:4Fe-4S binding protein [Heliomicrobium undosum]MZP28186.1 4Fe-4S dicluster domain-containing protein [Heliomicrobium undosum]